MPAILKKYSSDNINNTANILKKSYSQNIEINYALEGVKLHLILSNQNPCWLYVLQDKTTNNLLAFAFVLIAKKKRGFHIGEKLIPLINDTCLTFIEDASFFENKEAATKLINRIIKELNNFDTIAAYGMKKNSILRASLKPKGCSILTLQSLEEEQHKT